MATREAAAEIRARSRKLDPDLRKAKRKFDKFGKGVGRDLKRSFKGVTRTLTTLGGIGAGVGFAAIGRDVFQFEKKLTRLGIQAGISQKELTTFRNRVREVGERTGAGSDAVLEGARAFVSATGDFDGASEALEVFAKVAVASGADMADVTKTAAGLQKTLNIDAGQFEEAFGILLEAGKAGSVELKDLASVLGSTAPLFAKFGKDGTEGLKDLAAAFQVISPEFGFRPEEAATGLRSLLIALQKNRRKIEKEIGIDIRGMTLEDILTVFKDLGLGTEELTRVLGRAEGARAADALIKSLGRLDKEGNLAADSFERLVDTGGGIESLSKDFDAFNRSTAGRLQRAKEQIREVFARILTPERIEAIASAFERLADVIEFLAENLTAIVAIVAGGKLLALGAQAAAAAKALGLATAGAGAGAAGAAGTAAAGGALGVAATVAGVAALGVAAGITADKFLGLSDKLAGVEQNIIRPTKFDPTGQAARLRAQADAIERGPRIDTGFLGLDVAAPRTVGEIVASRAEARRRREQADVVEKTEQFRQGAEAGGLAPAAAAGKQIVEIVLDPLGFLKLENRRNRNVLRAP